MKRVWQCDRCGLAVKETPWDCPGCQRETCERCFASYAHCKTCSVGRSNEELRYRANAAGWDFE